MAGAVVTVPQTHKNSEQHRGVVPEGQLASGTPTAGFVPLATGTGEAAWTEPPTTGGGGTPCECCHEHKTERFVAAGATPEVFTISGLPLYGVRVHAQGLRADPDDVTVDEYEVSVDTSASDVVLIDYERECGGSPAILGGEGILSIPGTNAVHNGRNNLLATVVTTGPAFLSIDMSTALSSSDIYVVTDAGYTFSSFIADSTGIMLFPLPIAATYYVMGKFNTTYNAGLTGAGTYAWYYPAGAGTALSIPGTSDTWGGFDANRVGDFTSGQAAVFVTFTEDTSAGAYLAVLDAAEDDSATFYSPEIVAGTYVFVVHQANPGSDPLREAAPELYRIIVQLGDTTYHADLDGAGFYEVHTP